MKLKLTSYEIGFEDNDYKVFTKFLHQLWSSYHRVLVLVPSADIAKLLSDNIWKKSVFLPHGIEEDGFCDQQPVFITDKQVNTNNAEVIVLFNYPDCSQEFISNFQSNGAYYWGNLSELKVMHDFLANCKKNISGELTLKSYKKVSSDGSWEQADYNHEIAS